MLFAWTSNSFKFVSDAISGGMEPLRAFTCSRR